MLLLSILAGFLIAMGGAAANTAVYSLANTGLIRLISGLIFPFGLAIVALTGAELFTGNTLIAISVLSKQTTVGGLFKNWCVVYLGNAIGAVLAAAGCAFFGQMNYSAGELAVFVMKQAAGKCAMPAGNAVVLGIFCNVLVTLGVLLSLCAKDLPGRVMGAYLPVAFFVICGFEHCVANLFCVPAGLFAQQVPSYAALAAELGADLTALTWSNFFIHNLLPVTFGNIIGGVGVGSFFWACYGRAVKVIEKV